MDTKTSKEMAMKTAYAAVGAPVVAARKAKEFSTKFMSGAQDHIETYAAEGEKVAKQLKDRNVVEELEHRMNIDKVQDRVEQLRDQLENTLNNWRESFTPVTEEPAKKPAAKPAAKKAPAKKASAKPAAKKATAKTTAKKAPAKKKTPVTAASE